MFQIKQAMKNGEALIGIMIEEMTTPNIAKILAACGFK
jgi:2-keto-3-deoxy-L-rhamnonate aldolase RhmA